MENEGKKENKNEKKNQGKLNIAAGAIAVGKIVLIIAIILVLIAVSTWHVMVENGSFKEDDWSNTGYVVSQKALSNVSTENIAQNENGDWSINIDLDTTVDEIIQTLEDNDGVLDHYITESKQKEYLTAFIQAELITQYPDLRSADKIGTPTEEGEFQGCIKIHRALPDGTTDILTYVDYNTFKSYGGSEATKHFTLDESGNLVVAGWKRTTTNITSNVPDVENVTNKEEYKLETNSIPYKTIVEKYTMPFDLLWALTVTGNNKDAELAYNLAQLALDSQIIFTVQDNLTTEVIEQIEEYDVQNKRKKEATISATIVDELQTPVSENVKKEKENSPIHYRTTTVTKTEICATKVDITYADTWIVEYNNTYSNTLPGEHVDEQEPQEIEDTTYELISSGTLASDLEISAELRNMQIELCGSVEEYKKRLEEGTISGHIGTIRYEDYSRTINQKVNTKTTSSYNIYVQGTPNVDDKTEKDSSEDNFVTIFVKADEKTTILSAAEWLFDMLETSPKAADSVDLVKYLLYKATGKKYDGITEYDFSVFKQGNFKTSNGGRGLAAYLRQFSHSGDAPQSTDGNYYTMYGDGKGWPTIGTADIQWKSHYSKFKVAGKVLHNGQEKEVQDVAKYINDNCLTKGADAEYTDAEVSAMNIGIEKNLVDDIGNTIQQAYYTKVQEATDGLTLSRQQLYALTAVAYNFGSLPTRNDKTFKQTYEQGMQEYDEGSWEHNKYIWDNWWCALGGGAEGHIPARDAAYETYIKAVFDFSESAAGEVFGRSYYIYYTATQLARFDYAPNKGITRTTANEEEIFTMVKASGTFEPSYDDPKVRGYYTSTMGKVFTVLNQNKITGWGTYCNRAAAAIIASGYSEQSADELISIIDDNKKKYGWDTVATNDYFNLYGLQLDKDAIGHISVDAYKDIIRNQLDMGGYAMVWLNNGGTYIGKSGEPWTSKYHWVAVVDYRIENGIEEIMVLDYRGGDWYSIDEFQHGIARYALISEM